MPDWTYQAVRHDYEVWADALAPDGVLLLHDIAVRDRRFGVYRLWDELKTGGHSAEFTHSYGLGVLSRSASLDPAALQHEWRRRCRVMSVER